VQLLGLDEVKELCVLVLLDAAECVSDSSLELDFKVERPCTATATREIDTGDFLEADVNWRFVDVNESSF
jgi:hypothetical protein